MKKLVCGLLTLCLLLAGLCAVAEEGSVAGAYTFDEVAMGGAFTVPWVLELREDGTYQILEKNPFMGDQTYEGTYAVENGVVITGAFEGNPPQAAFFAADKTCRWTLNDDGTCVPVDYDASAAPNLGGQPEGDVPGQLPGGAPQAEEAGSLENIPYASQSASQVMDIFLPEGEGPFPVIVVAHGGGFLFGDQKMTIIQPVIETGVANGYAVASVDYRKSSEAPFPAALADVKAAVRFLRAHAEEYHLDAEHIAVWGESAGAYLSLMTALTPEVSALNGDVADNAEYASAVTALVDFYGPVRFTTLQPEAAELSFEFGGNFECQFAGVESLADDKVGETWWQTYADALPEGFALKAWIQAGTADTSVPYTQSERLASELAEQIGEGNVRFGLIEGAGHEDAAFYTEENLAGVFAYLNACMKEN